MHEMNSHICVISSSCEIGRFLHFVVFAEAGGGRLYIMGREENCN